MPLFVLDTDTFSLFLRGHPGVVANVLGRPLEETTTTIVTVEEELGGWYALLRRRKDRAALAQTYSRMTETVEALSQFRLLTFTEPAIARFEALRKRYPRIGRNGTAPAPVQDDFQRLAAPARSRLCRARSPQLEPAGSGARQAAVAVRSRPPRRLRVRLDPSG